MPPSRHCRKCGKPKRPQSFTGPRGTVCATCRRSTKAVRKKADHERRVTATYGLKPGEYDELLAKQGGVCAICKQPRRTRLDVDHDHKTGVVRGLLCARCNRQLLARGLLNSPQIARNAADYLEDPPAPRMIGERFVTE